MNILIVLYLITAAQSSDNIKNLNSFSLKLLDAVASNNDGNYVVSPMSVWNIFTLLTYASTGETFNQLTKALEHPKELAAIKEIHDNAFQSFDDKDGGVSVGHSSSIFVNNESRLDQTFCKYAVDEYDTEVFAANTTNPEKLADDINGYVQVKTKGMISEVVSESDVQDLKMMMVDVVTFKGLWTNPFAADETFKQPFLNDKGQIVGAVDMMFQKQQNSVAFIDRLSAKVIELPYGNNKEYAMLIFVPYNGILFDAAFKKIIGISVEEVYKELKSSESFELVDTFIPKFNITSDTEMIAALKILGIHDIFDKYKSNLPGISGDKVFVTKCLQKAAISVAENGTIASAATYVGLEDRIAYSDRFLANKPFVYFIVNRKSFNIIFAGVFRMPYLDI